VADDGDSDAGAGNSPNDADAVPVGDGRADDKLGAPGGLTIAPEDEIEGAEGALDAPGPAVDIVAEHPAPLIATTTHATQTARACRRAPSIAAILACCDRLSVLPERLSEDPSHLAEWRVRACTLNRRRLQYSSRAFRTLELSTGRDAPVAGCVLTATLTATAVSVSTKGWSPWTSTARGMDRNGAQMTP